MSFVAVSKVSFPQALREQILAVGMQMIPVARSQPGFISIAFHHATDSSETMMYWEWESKEAHEACIQSPDWLEIVKNSGELFQTEGVGFSIETYERLG